MKNRFLKIVTLISIMMSFTSCISFIKIGIENDPSYSENGYDIDKVRFHQNDGWDIVINERYSLSENGRDVYVDPFSVYSKNHIPYYMDIIPEGDLMSDYDGVISERFKTQAKGLLQDEKDGLLQLEEELMSGNQVIEYNRLHSGNWIAYCFGMLANGELTGDYQITRFQIIPEEPEKEYINWLGEWEIGDNLRKYRIQIQTDEPNYSFHIHGWEGNDSNTKDYVLSSDYDRSSKDMLFYQQILKSFQGKDGNWYDTMFCGSFHYQAQDQEEELVTFIGPSTIAKAVQPGEDKRVHIIGLDANTELDGQDYSFQFDFMQLKDVPEDEKLPMFSYNQEVPELPYYMYRVNENISHPLSDDKKAYSRRKTNKPTSIEEKNYRK